mmetsp:Transcript_3076/g.4661  ORF Transcript_3076/g.4661 Transcript_3076/m.4661 type:complete len:570 (+) Transcript_3076:101-1810(+)|eukprot:CAMPEP_0194240194 /NCGR_PEP_ID=MMETSP0158-20130606/6432_1 /TAXON_ID=33649 /ORGANISM="Thalassionema nitzschioides, Strain L26-B" /LENGTH=569 /DNA_ID=CAMNT_0038974843 /DNA_START=68 /DNA_END=1777 /DNA_ORIENTATION=-
MMSSQDDEAQAAAENAPVRVSRSIMVGWTPSSISNDNSSVDLDISDRSNAYIRRGSSTIDSDDEQSTSKSTASAPPKIQSSKKNNYNVEDLVPGSVADAGLNAYGCVYVEVWIMNPNGTALSCVERWMDPSFANSLPSEELKAKALELNRFAPDCPPGAGLAGTIFNEADKKIVHWRQIKAMLNDPFVQRDSGQRMKRFYEIGLGLVGAVPFSFQDDNGLVCFFARSKVNVELLRSSMNERFMIGATDLIGANYAIRKNREECAAMRRELLRKAVQKVKKEFRKSKKATFTDLATNKSTLDLLATQREEALLLREEDMATRVKKNMVKFGKRVWKRINNSRKKWRGTNLQGPARQSFGESAFIVFGVFFTMLTVLKIAKAINSADPSFEFNPAWYGSSLCIIFALTPAPVGQPLQIFAAHLWNMLVGLALRQIPLELNSVSYGIPLIWKQALSVAIGVAGQAKLGILHPPATGLSYAFVTPSKLADGSYSYAYSWGTIASVYLVDAAVVALSVLILNLSEAKQYPLFWFGLEWGDICSCFVYSRGKTIPLIKAVSNKLGRPVKGDDDNV